MYFLPSRNEGGKTGLCIISTMWFWLSVHPTLTAGRRAIPVCRVWVSFLRIPRSDGAAVQLTEFLCPRESSTSVPSGLRAHRQRPLLARSRRRSSPGSGQGVGCSLGGSSLKHHGLGRAVRALLPSSPGPGRPQGEIRSSSAACSLLKAVSGLRCPADSVLLRTAVGPISLGSPCE